MNNVQLFLNSKTGIAGSFKITNWYLLLISAVIIAGCSTNSPEPQLSLTVEDYSCTEVWLKVKGLNSDTFMLERDGKEINSDSLIDGNIIYNDSLLPNTNYSYQIIRTSDQENSNTVAVTTPDTTSHNFTWQFDTLAYPESYQTLVDAIWGSSENDVYAGHNDRSAGQLWHWDGLKWQSLVNSDGPIVAYDLRGGNFYDIDGSSSEDVWIVGDNYINYPEPSGLILHYNGTEWVKKEYGKYSFLSVWAGSTDNVWCGSADGKLLHFDGAAWQEFDIGFEAQVNDITGFSEQEVYAHAIKGDEKAPDDSLILCFLKYNGQTWQIMDSYLYTLGQTEEYFGNYLWGNADSHQLYSSGNRVYRLEEDKWTIATENAKGKITGSGENNIFLVWSNVYHYNGNTWKTLSKLPQLNWSNIWCNEKYVFITSHLFEDVQKTLVIRGTQQ